MTAHHTVAEQFRGGKSRVSGTKMHSAVDVLLCTASILNICLISLDRYWSISRAVEYIKVRSVG